MKTFYTDIYTDVEIDISNYCNLNCPLCHRNNFGSEAYKLNDTNMNVKDFERLFEVFPNLQRIYLGFMVSEPTLNPNFVNIVKYIKENGKNITLSTNGNTFYSDSERSNSFWNSFLPLLTNDDKIIWPIDGFSNEIYTKYRKNGNLEKVIHNLKRATKINPKINHEIQTIMFRHNKEDIELNHDNFKKEYNEVFHNPNWNIIDCCGDCATLSDEVLPLWDKKKWIEIKSNPPKSPKGFRCESFDNKIVFVDHMGRIGFCPTQLTNSVQINKVPTIYTSKEEINSYCENTYGNKYNNKICQFNCGTLSKLKKERAGLSNVYTK